MPKSRYSDEQRANALALYAKHGPAEASRRTGIPKKTIASWARRSHVQTDAPQVMTAAIDMAKLTRDEKRVHLQDLILEKAIDVLRRMDEPHKDFKVTKNGIQEVVFDKATSTDCKNYATSAATLVDKFRLELGEATELHDDISVVRNKAEGLVSKFREKPTLEVVPDSA